MKTFSEIRQNIDAILEKRRESGSVNYLGQLTREDKVALAHLNYEINGLNSVPNAEAMTEFRVEFQEDAILVKGGVGSFGMMFTENADYPDGMSYDNFRSVMKEQFGG